MADDRVALVTGASRGIGKEIAKHLHEAGFQVVINFLASESAAQKVTEELRDGARAIAAQADVSDAAAVARLKELISEEFGRLDVLVNNAGATLAAPWRDVSPDRWRQALDVNLSSVFACIQAFAPMLSHTEGNIVNIGSTYGEIGVAQIAAYSAAKAGIVALTRAFAKELAPTVRVNAVLPGNIDTDMTRSAGDELINAVIKQTPLARLGTPAEVADAVAFICSKRASFITGQVLVIDGGHSLR